MHPASPTDVWYTPWVALLDRFVARRRLFSSRFLPTRLRLASIHRSSLESMPVGDYPLRGCCFIPAIVESRLNPDNGAGGTYAGNRLNSVPGEPRARGQDSPGSRLDLFRRLRNRRKRAGLVSAAAPRHGFRIVEILGGSTAKPTDERNTEPAGQAGLPRTAIPDGGI